MKILIICSEALLGQRLQKGIQRLDHEVDLYFDFKNLYELDVSSYDKFILGSLNYRSGTAEEAIRLINNPSKVYFVVRSVSIDTIMYYRDLGVAGFITDPINIERIQSTILEDRDTQVTSTDIKGKKSSKSIKVEPETKSVDVKVNKVSVTKPEVKKLVFVKGSSPKYIKLYSDIDLITKTNIPIIINGETGTGKEHIAKLIHSKSGRLGNLVTFDCGAVNSQLALSELFGHVKGSFTDAKDNRNGVFIEANNGTLFLDEVENLSMEVQVNLLRALQEQRIRRVGESKDIPVNVRVIVATNCDLKKLVNDGRFRQDLYYRLAGYELEVPPLRECSSDIPKYVQFFVDKYSFEFNKTLFPIQTEVMDWFVSQPWTGNVRELQNTIRLMVLKSNSYLQLPSDDTSISDQVMASNDKFGLSRKLGLDLFSIK